VRQAIARSEGQRVAAVFAVPLSCALGYAVATNPALSFLIFIAAIGAIAFAIAPPTAWVLAAVVAAVTFRGTVELGVLPSGAAYLDIPLAWGAFAIALLRGRVATRFARHLVIGIGALFFTTLVSASLNGSETVRPLFYFGLIGEPFAIVAALLLDDRGADLRRPLAVTMSALIVLQIPLALFQFVEHGAGDGVQGTLYGSEAGAHLMSALVALGLVWWLTRSRNPLAPRALPITVTLTVVPFLAAAKQVIVALPAVLALRPRGVPRRRRIATVAVVAASLVALFYVPSVGATYVFPSLERTTEGHSGKVIALEQIWQEARSDSVNLLFGQGPAQTVSHSAFLSTDPLSKADSPVAILGIEPSDMASDFAGFSSAGSFDSPRSSAIGLAGDLGLLGTLAYLVLLLLVLRAVRRTNSREAAIGTAALLMFGLLGLVNDWWEQSAFTVPVGVLAGLALTGGHPEPAMNAARPHRRMSASA
jgi:hypothetical protein